MNYMCYSHIRNSMLWNRERRLKSCWESIKNDESFTSLIYLLIITTCFVDNKYNFKEGVRQRIVCRLSCTLPQT